eukprot:7233846-Alexandrium_andersonii.AAC.1
MSAALPATPPPGERAALEHERQRRARVGPSRELKVPVALLRRIDCGNGAVYGFQARGVASAHGAGDA